MIYSHTCTKAYDLQLFAYVWYPSENLLLPEECPSIKMSVCDVSISLSQQIFIGNIFYHHIIQHLQETVNSEIIVF